MRVIFSNHSTAPVNLGGAERSLLKLVDDWTASNPDLEPFFFTKAPTGLFTKALDERSWKYRAFRFRGWALPSVQPAPVVERTTFAAADYQAVGAMITELERLKPDLVVTNTLVAPWAAFAAKTLGIPHAWFVREYGDLDHDLKFQEGRERTLADIGLLSEAVFTNSLALKRHVASQVPDDKISVVYPSVDTASIRTSAEQDPATVPFPLADPGLKITVVGRVEPGKGQFRAVDALGLLKADGVDASLCLVGSWKTPGYDLELRDRAAALGVADRVTFAGEQDNPYPYVAAADVCVTPSTIEAFGRTTLEYLAVGRPVVASSTGGSAELVEPGVTGSLFDPESPRELADALAVYAATPGLAETHGAAAAMSVERVLESGFSQEAAIARLESLVGAPAYKLPDIARYWFALPGDYASLGATTARMAAGLLASRLRTRSGMVGRILRRPGVATRRILGR
ncbi:glycosyltransferase family 4 protein [Frondihabitans peucedani]|uniref:D-inositol 3-phosphate glycosyltransferase n=1 Tax=Frondihabitans peucedani TaxID=598626 RepID=A0ABP8DZQ4_9MICO